MKGILSRINKIVRQNKIIAVLALVAVIAVSGVTVNQSLAYFTTYATAKGGVTLELGHTSRIKEGFKDWEKTIQVENTGDVDEYVRVKIIAASQFEITVTGDKWTLGEGGYYYYSDVVPVGGLTDSINAYIKVADDVDTSFNIVVIQECIPANMPDADWSISAEYEIKEAGN